MYGSTLLLLRGGGWYNISRKKMFCNSWMTPYCRYEPTVFKRLFSRCIGRWGRRRACLGHVRTKLRPKVDAFVSPKQAFLVSPRIATTSQQGGCDCSDRDDAGASDQIEADPKADLHSASLVRSRRVLEYLDQFRDPVAEAVDRNAYENYIDNRRVKF